MHEAIDWIRTHPARFRQLTAQRIAYFWFRPSNAPAVDFFPFIWPLLGAYGLALLWPQNRPVAAVILSTWICSQLPYLFVQVSPRYRYPIDWSLLLMSMFAIREIVRQHQSPSAEPSPV
jgi:Na+-transporting NADH:ubiquinone oxidoreductase subunit NqrB